MLPLVICMPLRDEPEPETRYALTQNVGRDYSIIIERGLPVDVARNRLASRARRSDADYVLWLDSDMYFWPGAVQVLITTLDHSDIVCGHFGDRFPYSKPRAWDVDGNRIDSLPEHRIIGLSECGFGMVAHRRQFLDLIGADPFTVLADMTEEMAFCKRAREVGASILLNENAPVAHCENGKAFLPGRGYAKIINGQICFEPWDGRPVETIAIEHVDSMSWRSYGRAVDEAIETAGR